MLAAYNCRIEPTTITTYTPICARTNTMSQKLRKFKINGLPTDKVFAGLSFGQQLEHFAAIVEFKQSCKSTHLSQKRQTYSKAIREAMKLYGATEYYCEFFCDSEVKDDSFEFWYR